MHKSIPVSIALFLLYMFISPTVHATNQCLDLLSSNTQIATTTSLKEVTANAIKILNLMKKTGLIKDEHYFSHAKKDLENTEEEIERKMDNEIFENLLSKWAALMDKTLAQFENYDNLSTKDKEVWAYKLEVIGKFSIGQFVTFVETEGKITAKSLYKIQNQILMYMNALPDNAGFKIFSYELEKQIKRFFSITEIINCKF